MGKYPCGNWTWENRVTKEHHPFLCRKGRCDNPECRKIWANSRISRISYIVQEYSLDKFFTLTLERNISLEKAWGDISYLWGKMRHRLKREAKKAGIDFHFIAVLEAHKDGYPHIHGFTNLYLEVEGWSRHWQECGAGKIVWVEPVKDSVKVGRYLNKQLDVAKYVGKDNILNALDYLPKRRRTIWRSKRLYDALEKEKMALTSGRECGKIEVKWILLRRRKEDAQTERQRPNMETACCTIPEESTYRSIQKMDST